MFSGSSALIDHSGMVRLASKLRHPSPTSTGTKCGSGHDHLSYETRTVFLYIVQACLHQNGPSQRNSSGTIHEQPHCTVRDSGDVGSAHSCQGSSWERNTDFIRGCITH